MPAAGAYRRAGPATGMLPICASAKRQVPTRYLLDSDKTLSCYCPSGAYAADTSDADGQIVRESVTFGAEQLARRAGDTFIGDIEQIPSMADSALVSGQKLYPNMPAGVSKCRAARPITVYELLFIRRKFNELELEVHCSKGTYIRTIIDDLGEKLGCGAHVTYRRLTVSKYPVDRMVTLGICDAGSAGGAAGRSAAQMLDPY